MHDPVGQLFHHFEIPFSLQRCIMEWSPRLPKWNPRVFTILQHHFGRKYCQRCGDYQDFRHVSSSRKRRLHRTGFSSTPFPKHVHFGRTRTTQHTDAMFRMPLTTWLTVVATLRPRQSTMTQYAFDMVSTATTALFRTSTVHHYRATWMLFRKHQIVYLYSFTHLLNGLSLVTPLININVINPFTNPSFHLTSDYTFFPPLVMPVSLRRMTSTEELTRFLQILIDKTPSLHPYLLAKIIIYDENILHQLVIQSETATMSLLLNELSMDREYDSMFVRILDHFPHVVEYMSEPHLNAMFQSHQEHFLTWYHHHRTIVASLVSYSLVESNIPV